MERQSIRLEEFRQLKKDAANAADLVSQGRRQYYDLPEMALRDVRSLLASRFALKKHHHRIRMRIRNNLVAQYFPELDKLWGKSQAENLAIVRWCLAPEKIARLEFDKFFQMVTTRSRGDGQYRRLRGIWERAHQSIGCRAGSALDLEARIMVETLHQVEEHLGQVDAAIEQLCKEGQGAFALCALSGRSHSIGIQYSLYGLFYQAAKGPGERERYSNKDASETGSKATGHCMDLAEEKGTL